MIHIIKQNFIICCHLKRSTELYLQTSFKRHPFPSSFTKLHLSVATGTLWAVSHCQLFITAPLWRLSNHNNSVQFPIKFHHQQVFLAAFHKCNLYSMCDGSLDVRGTNESRSQFMNTWSLLSRSFASLTTLLALPPKTSPVSCPPSVSRLSERDEKLIPYHLQQGKLHTHAVFPPLGQSDRLILPTLPLQFLF